VLACGSNSFFQLAIDRDEDESTKIFPPRKSLFSVPFDSDLHITSISSGAARSIVLYSNGCCFSAGSLEDGHLGIDKNQVAEEDLREGVFGKSYCKPHQIILPGNVFVVKISCGDEHSALLTREGDCFMFGSNEQGQCGVGEGAGNWIDLPLQFLLLIFPVEVVTQLQSTCSIRSTHLEGTNLVNVLLLKKMINSGLFI